MSSLNFVAVSRNASSATTTGMVVWAMVSAGIAALAAGLVLAWPRLRAACFAGGAIALTGAAWSNGKLRWLGRAIVAATLVFYAVQHFLYLRFVPGVPLEKLTPAWIPAATLIAFVIGFVELAAGPALLFQRTHRVAAAVSGAVLVLLVAFFYLPILAVDFRSDGALEAINYVGDTLLFAATLLLAGVTSTCDHPRGRGDQR